MLPRSLLLFSLSALFMKIATAYSTGAAPLSSTPTCNTKSIKLQVCQDKNCCKRFTSKSLDLVQTLRQLSPLSTTTAIDIEATTCLTHCEQGPNVRIVTANDDKDTVVSIEKHVTSAASAAAILELATTNQVVHPTLLAACNVMERAHKATTRKEKERFLNSVIKALEKENHLALSKSMAHALVMRARLTTDDQNKSTAREDAIRAAELDPLHPMVWRVLVDASPNDPTDALQQWAQYQPQFATKIKKELAQYYDDAAASITSTTAENGRGLSA